MVHCKKYYYQCVLQLVLLYSESMVKYTKKFVYSKQKLVSSIKCTNCQFIYLNYCPFQESRLGTSMSMKHYSQGFILQRPTWVLGAHNYNLIIVMYKFFRRIKFEMHKWKLIQTFFYLLFEVKLEKPNKFHNCENVLEVLAIKILYKISIKRKRKRTYCLKSCQIKENSIFTPFLARFTPFLPVRF
jgi:hypothetical protein